MPSENSVQKCSCVHAVWDLFTVGGWGEGGLTERKLIWDRGKQWKREEWHRDRERERESPGRQFSLAQEGSLGSPLSPLFTHREILDNFTAPLSVAIEKGQIPSWLLTIYPVRVVAIMGKSKPLASSVVTSLRSAIASVQTAAPRNACEICVCVRFRAQCWD